MSDALEAAGFTHLAPMLGRAVWESRRRATVAAGARAAFLHNSTEGWALALTSLRDLYANAEWSAVPPTRRSVAPLVDDQDASVHRASCARLGKVVAEMHLALAAGAPGTDMAPAPLTEEALNGWANTMTGELDELLARDEPSLDPLRDVRPGWSWPGSTRSAGCRQAACSPASTVTCTSASCCASTPAGRCSTSRASPTGRLPQRRELSTPLRDVAAMLRSFDYAAAAAIVERTAPDSARPSAARLR